MRVIERLLHRQAAATLSAAGSPAPVVAEQVALGAEEGDAESAEALIRSARGELGTSPGAACDLSEAALRIIGRGSQRHDYLLLLADTRLRAGAPQAAAGTLTALLSDPSASPAQRFQACLQLLWIQLLQAQLPAAARTVDILLGLPASRFAPAERTLLRLLADTEQLIKEPSVLSRALDDIAAGGALAQAGFTRAALHFVASIVMVSHGHCSAAVDHARASIAFSVAAPAPHGHDEMTTHLASYLLSCDDHRGAEELLAQSRRAALGPSVMVMVLDLFARVSRAQWDAIGGLNEQLLAAPEANELVVPFHAFVASLLARIRRDAASIALLDAGWPATGA